MDANTGQIWQEDKISVVPPLLHLGRLYFVSDICFFVFSSCIVYRCICLYWAFRLRLHGIGYVHIRLGSDPLCLHGTGSKLEGYGST